MKLWNIYLHYPMIYMYFYLHHYLFLLFFLIECLLYCSFILVKLWNVYLHYSSLLLLPLIFSCIIILFYHFLDPVNICCSRFESILEEATFTFHFFHQNQFKITWNKIIVYKMKKTSSLLSFHFSEIMKHLSWLSFAFFVLFHLILCHYSYFLLFRLPQLFFGSFKIISMEGIFTFTFH